MQRDVGRRTKTYRDLIRDTRLLAVYAGVFVLTLAICLISVRSGFDLGFVDIAHDGYQLGTARILLSGHTLFRGAFTQYGVTMEYLNALSLYVFGEYLYSLKLFVSLLYAVSALLIFEITRRNSSLYLAVGVFGFWLLSAPFYRHGIMVSPHALAMLLQLTVVGILIQQGERGSRLSYFVLGVLTGVLFATKQSIGTFQAAALGLIIIGQCTVIKRDYLKLLESSLMATSGFLVVIIPIGVALYWAGALGDWEKQTIAFPRLLYLNLAWPLYYGPVADAHPIVVGKPLHMESLPRIVQLVHLSLVGPAGQPDWMLFRLALLGLFTYCFASGAKQLGLIGSVSLFFLSLGNFPSWNFMHQWWTFAPIMPLLPLIYLHMKQRFVRVAHINWGDLLRRKEWASVTLGELWFFDGLSKPFIWALAVVGVLGQHVIAPNLDLALLFSRVKAATVDCVKVKSLVTLRGMCTTVGFARDLDAVASLVAQAKADAPERPVASIETSMGYFHSPRALLLTAALPNNPPAHPIAWQEPVLSDAIYPDRLSTLRAHEAILIDFSPHGLVRKIDGYRAWASEPDTTEALDGLWTIYLPEGDAAATPARAQPPQDVAFRFGERINFAEPADRVRRGEGWLEGSLGLHRTSRTAELVLTCPVMARRYPGDLAVILSFNTISATRLASANPVVQFGSVQVPLTTIDTAQGPTVDERLFRAVAPASQICGDGLLSLSLVTTDADAAGETLRWIAIEPAK